MERIEKGRKGKGREGSKKKEKEEERDIDRKRYKYTTYNSFLTQKAKETPPHPSFPTRKHKSR